MTVIYPLVASYPSMLRIAIEHETQRNQQGRKGSKYHVMSNAEVVQRDNGNYSMS